MTKGSENEPIGVALRALEWMSVRSAISAEITALADEVSVPNVRPSVAAMLRAEADRLVRARHEIGEKLGLEDAQ